MSENTYALHFLESQAYHHSQIPQIPAQATSLSNIPAWILGPLTCPAHQLIQRDTHNHTFAHSSHKYSGTCLTALFTALISHLYDSVSVLGHFL